jgi:hypothetical protein
MYRIKLTMKDGREVRGLFVYDLDEKQMERRVKRMSWILPKSETGKVIGKASIDFFEVTRFPAISLFDPNSIIWDFEDVITKMLEKLEILWRVYDDREDIEEVEEGSA